MAADGLHAYFVAQALDLESVRIAVRQCGAEVRWKYEIHDQVLNEQLIPNMVFEVFISENLDTNDIPQMVQSWAPCDAVVRIMREVSGACALVFAHTQCRTIKPVAGVTIKSLQPLL